MARRRLTAEPVHANRYPVGLDATVFISASGSKQTMSFTNDTDYPMLIRGMGWRNGGSGYVKFEVYSVPNGRRVTFATGPKRNYRAPSDVVEYTSSLPAGSAKRIEYPVAGFQVSVTRTVRDRAGKVVDRDAWFSNYARITGSPSSAADPSPEPSDGSCERCLPRLTHDHRPPSQTLGDRLGFGAAETEPAQRVARHLHSELALPVHRLHLSAERSEMGRLAVAVRADHDVDARIEGLDALDDQARLVRL
jgi:hypothetical protein